MSEAMMIWYIPLCGVLFAVGGTYNKAWRRFGIPLVTFLVMVLCGIISSKAAITCVLLGGALHLGYGETKSWLYKFMVGCLLILPSYAIGITLWQLLFPFIFISLFFFSNYKKIASQFPWKVCEVIMGITLGVTYSLAL